MKTQNKKTKIDRSYDSPRKESFCDKQFSQKKQSSCENVSQIVTEKSFSTPNRSSCDKSQTRIVNLVQTNDHNDSNELIVPEEIDVQSKNLKLFFFSMLSLALPR